MTLLIESPGILTTVQDLGRNGYRRFGINPGGAMDRTAARLINLLLGNHENGAVLEMHYPAAVIRFESDTIFAIGGAEFGPRLDDSPVRNWQMYKGHAGQKLTCTAKELGSRCYLAVRGGLDIEPWLGSASTNLAAKVGGHAGRRLEADDRIKLRQTAVPSPVEKSPRVSASLIPRYSRFPTVRIIAGAEYNTLSQTLEQSLLTQAYQVSNNSNRMGFRLSAEPIILDKSIEILSSAVDFGTIQLLPDGQLIILMADHQTTGGYPRLAHVASVDLPLLGQLGPGDKVAFHLIDHEHAEELLIQTERELSFFKVGCRLLART